MRKIFRSLLVCSIMLVTILQIRPQKIVANAVKFQIQLNYNAYWMNQNNIQTLPLPNSGSSVAYGDYVRMDFSLVNQTGNINSYVRFIQKEAMEFLPYRPGVLVVNGQNVNEAQYYEAIGSRGFLTTLSSSSTKISLSVKAIGTNKNRISTDIQISSPHITQGLSSVTYDCAFIGSFAFPIYHVVQYFSEDGSLIKTDNVLHNTILQNPNIYTKEGYDFLGFNTAAEGNGTYFSGGIIQTSMNLYAVLKIKQFNVKYYIDGILYESSVVAYGKNAKDIKAPDKEKNKFVRWDGNLNNIRADEDVYAVYEKQAKKNTKVKVKKNASMDGENMIEEAITLILNFEKKDMNIRSGGKNVKVVQVDRDTSFAPLLVAGVAFVGIVGGAWIFRRKKSEPK